LVLSPAFVGELVKLQLELTWCMLLLLLLLQGPLAEPIKADETMWNLCECAQPPAAHGSHAGSSSKSSGTVQ
jgi:hypothetical protein